MKKVIFKEFKNYVTISIGSIIAAISISVLLVPYKIAPGGVSGLATVIYHASAESIPVGVSMLVMNIPLFIAGMGYIGKSFILRTLYGTVSLSFCIELIDLYLLPQLRDFLTQDILLTSIFGGFLMGAGLGLVFKAGATTGGSDLAARIVHRFIPGFTIGQHLLFIDTTIIVIAAWVFKSFELGMYAIVTLFISSKVIDAILEGVNFAKALFIVSDKPEAIADRIMSELERGVTALNGKGMYTQTEKQVLLCVVQRSEMQRLREIVKSEDEKAFVIMADIREVVGEGFSQI